MSDVPVETGAPAEEVAPDIGQGEPEAAPPSYLETDQYADHHVRVRVDGQEVSVPLREAIDGYSRQADYTRKTQELAEQQRRAQFGLTLQQALEANPAETLRILQSQYQAQEPEPQAEPQVPDWTDSPDEAKRWQEMDARLQRFEQQQADNELRVAVGVLQQRYGDEFDPAQVVQTAFAQGRMDLEAVYKEMAFDRYWQGQQAANQSKAADEAARIDAKSQTDQIHSGNGSANAVEPSIGSFPTIEESYAEAKRTLGLV